MNQIRSLAAPAELRERLRALTITQMVRTCASFRPGAGSDVDTTTKITLRVLARRVKYLDAEVAELDERRTSLVAEVAPQLLAAHGVGPHTAATLLVAVGDNPERVRNEATFARLCGVAPIPAGSGKTDGNHRLHRGGDRQANSALWTIVLSRMATHPDTRAYVERLDQGRQADALHHALPQAPRRPRNFQAPATTRTGLDDLRRFITARPPAVAVAVAVRGS